jgi:hypothetical protein
MNPTRCSAKRSANSAARKKPALQPARESASRANPRHRLSNVDTPKTAIITQSAQFRIVQSTIRFDTLQPSPNSHEFYQSHRSLCSKRKWSSSRNVAPDHRLHAKFGIDGCLHSLQFRSLKLGAYVDAHQNRVITPYFFNIGLVSHCQ